MEKDMWTKFVKKKREKTDKIWLKFAENTIRKIVKKPAVDFNSTNNKKVAKKNEQTIFGSRHPLKKTDRVVFIAMQDIGTTDYEKNSTDAKSIIWSRNKENQGGIKNYLKILQGMKSTLCDNSTNFTKTKEKTIFGSRHSTLYFGIVKIKNINRVAFIVMQNIGTTNYEQNSTDVKSGAEKSRTGENITGGIQVVLVGYGILSANPEGFPRSGFPKGISVYHRDTSVIVLQ